MTKDKENQKKIDTLAEKFTTWIGSPLSLVLHTILFGACFILPLFGISFEKVLLVLTTAVSLEAIYLSIFIQMALNRANKAIEDVEEDIDEIQEDIDEIQEDVGEITEDIDELHEDDEMVQKRQIVNKSILEKIRTDLTRMIDEIEDLKK